MNKKRLILVILFTLTVLLSASAVSAEDSAINDSILTNITSTEVTVVTTDTNDQIQEKINSLNDGDTLNFEKGDYNDICLYVNATSITINGNGATLHGLNNLTTKDLGEVKEGYIPGRIPEIISNKTTEGGYGISNPATLYILKTDNLVINDLNIVAGTNSGTDKGADTARYSNCLVYNYQSTNTQIINSTFDGSTWGIYFYQSTGGLIEGNRVKNQGVTGIFNFQTPNTIIRNNTVTNAKNHGIDVRHMVGPNVKVLDNKIVESKEGIYLLHSGKHTVTGNTIINCSLSSITCCGANNVLIENNTLQNSRIGVLLAGSAPVGGSYVGYTNITIGTNEWKLDQLPFPPSFVFYVAKAKSDYATVESMMGTHSDSLYGDTYTEYTGIETPEPIVVSYDTILEPTETTKTITSGMTNTEIQETINSMNDGDTLIFEENAVFEDICIYIDKDIKVIGNNATLKGMNTVSYDYVPEIVTNRTSAGGYAIPNIAILYVLNTTNAVISDLNIVSNYPGYTMPCQPGTENYNAYYTTGIYAGLSKNLVITGCTINGASWGIFVGGRPDGDYKYGCQNVVITNNIIKNQYTTGIINFASPNSIIANNTVINAVNHGIDVRFPAGFGAKVFNNTISGSKEGIYLLHSYGHYVYNNTISNCKISSITCYGSHDEYIYNNTLSKSRIAILLGGSSQNSFYNVTIGPNTFDGDKLPFPPTFAFTLAKSENQYQSATDVIGTYSDKLLVTIDAEDVETAPYSGEFNITLTDQNGKALANKKVQVTIGNGAYPAKTDANGTATIPLDLAVGNYTAAINFAGTDAYAKASATANIIVNKLDTTLTVPDVTTTYNTGGKVIATLKDINDNPVSGVNVKITVGNIAKTLKTNANGQASLDISSLDVGTYTATVKSATTDIYNRATATANVIVNITSKLATVLEVDDVTTTYNTGANIVATLKDNAGNAVSGVNVKITVGTLAKTLKTNANGQVSLDISSLDVGTYTASVKSATTNIYDRATATASVIVNKINTTLTVPDVVALYNTTGSVVATLTDIDGNAISGVNVKITVGSLAKTLKTNTNGQASLDISSLDVGTYTATVKSASTAIYNWASTVTATVDVVSKLSTILTVPDVVALNNSGKIVATLTDINDNPVSGVNVKITVGSLAKTLKTNANGQVSLDISSLDIGTYAVAVKSATTDIYERATATATAEVVSKLPTTLTVPEVTTTYSSGNIIATLKDINGNPVSGVNIKITVGSLAKTLKTDANGQVSLDISSLTPGNYAVSVKSATTDIYERATATSNVIVNKINTTLTAQDVTTTKNSGKKMVATLRDMDGNAVSGVNVKITVGSLTKTIKTNTNGQVSLDVSVLDIGSYTATIKSASTDIYNWASQITANVTITG